jgi:hypothetical protein
MSEKIGFKFKEFLAKEGKVDDNGHTDLTLAQYKDFAKTAGVTDSIIKQMAELDKEISTGVLLHAVDKVNVDIEAAKKKGASDDELKAIEHTVRVTLPNGKRYVTVKAYKESSNPSNRDAKVVHCPVVRDRTKLTKAIEKSELEAAEAFIKKSLGLK